MRRAVLDTNVVVSALLFRGATSELHARTTADDPIAAMADAAFNMGLTIPFDNQKDHGLDH